jgi:hypothetical protein
MESKITEVHVVFKTHLDLGFTDFARNVLRRYLDDYIPSALRLARETRGSPDRFVWTMGSWLIYQFLEKASATNKRRMEEAIHANDIHWHALPFTTHTELMDADLFRAGLRYSQQLDERFGRKTRAAKMTDVPGHTRAVVPLLMESGVRLLHLGVNPASTVPSVPPVFLWRTAGSEIVVIYEKVYGATTILPGRIALSVNLTGDNKGPQNSSEVRDVYQGLRQRFPSAQVNPGSLDSVVDRIWRNRNSLPVVTAEIGDTWIHGVGTDPQKVARFRNLCRLRSRWLRSGKLLAARGEDKAFAENLLLLAEHTWGMDIKTHLHDWSHYGSLSLKRHRTTLPFRTVARSWAEQRAYVSAALRALPPNLASEARKELSQLRISTPARVSTRPLSKRPFRLGPWTVDLKSDGSIQRLIREGHPQPFADERHSLGALGYQLFSPDDYRRFYRQYNTLDVDWARRDFTKPGMPQVRCPGFHLPRLVSLDVVSEDEVRLGLRFAPALRGFGVPDVAWILLRDHPHGLDLRLEWKTKPATRMAEAFWLTFKPRIAAGTAWMLEKLGQPLDPSDVVPKGNRQLHAVSGPVRTAGFSILSLDAPSVAPGRPSLLDFNNRLPARDAGVSFNLYNNVWGTNFPMWYSDSAVFRFELRWEKLKQEL